MPTNEWNLNWAKNLDQFKRGEIQGEHYGDQWGDPETNKNLKQVVDRFIVPFTGKGVSCLEIGSGGGRWTQYLQDCERVYCVELNPEMLEYLKLRFPDAKNFRFVQTVGSDFPGIPDNSIDFVFSFGVLVHLDFRIIKDYITNLVPLLRMDARISIQFSNKQKPMARDNPDFSDNNPEKMTALLEDNGFHVEECDDLLLPHSTVISARYRGSGTPSKT